MQETKNTAWSKVDSEAVHEAWNAFLKRLERDRKAREAHGWSLKQLRRIQYAPMTNEREEDG